MIETDVIPWFAAASRRKRWLVGVSGGADSVALLHLLVEAGFRRLVVCHLDHGLRGRASAGDARFVRRLAEKLGLPSEIGRADVAARMAENGGSLETAARHERHAFFAECARKHRCPRIILAHHADDQAETVLWNLLRGSHGLKGMEETRGLVTRSGSVLEIHRPLLSLRRETLVAWLESRRIKWREDASNAEGIAVRNRLRNEAIPLLREISGRDPALGFLRLLADWNDQREIGEWAVSHAAVTDPQGRLHLPAWRALPPALQRATLADFLKTAGVNPERDLLERALEITDVSQAAAINLPGSRRLRRSGGRLWIEEH